MIIIIILVLCACVLCSCVFFGKQKFLRCAACNKRAQAKCITLPDDDLQLLKSGARRFVCNACKTPSSPASPNIGHGISSQAAASPALLPSPSLTAATTQLVDLAAELVSLRALLLDALEGISFLTDQVAKLGEDNEQLRREGATKAEAHADAVKSLRQEVLSLRGDLARLRGSTSAGSTLFFQLHLKEQGQLIKSAPALTTKSLNPSNMERQNVKLALKIFSPSTAAALRACGPKLQLEHVAGTAEFLELITKWWSIVNVKTCNKGIRLRDELQSPIASVTSPQVHFLVNIVEWLDLWQSLRFDTGVLTRETHSALRLTTDTLVKVTKYCLNELHFDYVLLGKFQTDSLEERFGKYRQLSGAQYHISIRQVYESERKLRLQNVLELPEMEAAADAVAVNNAVLDDFEIELTDQDYDMKVPNLPAITYVAGYCAHAAFKKLSCMACKESLMLDDDIEVEGGELIKSMTRGGLKFPQPAIVNAVVTAEIVLDKLRSEQHAQQFHALPK